MMWLLAVVALCALAPGARCASNSVEWCYHQDSCNDTLWPTIAGDFCNGSRQSPININTAAVTENENLTAFTFTNFNSTTHLTEIENTGRTVKVKFAPGILVSGGNLPEVYDSLQFHLHWGKGSSVPGSEHTVDGVRSPMELHIVNIKSSLNLNTTAAIADSEGLAALGFLIEVLENSTNQPDSWLTLTNYLSSIPNATNHVNISGISLDSLLVGVNFTKYYRYHGSLTTPNCNEAVIWTVFKDPIKVSKNLIDRFSNTVYFTNSSSSVFMANVFRDIQPEQPVQSQRSSSSSSSTVTCSLGLIFLSLVLWKS
ncbi:carbonic anhydrase 4-like [Nelusetta ayraudi]|uniref:carbonic anhydrase 4-like n=1 Tax=Nelusetta ayraudi TaxID=303726 RepID=UPI003F6EF9C8